MAEPCVHQWLRQPLWPSQATGHRNAAAAAGNGSTATDRRRCHATQASRRSSTAGDNANPAPSRNPTPRTGSTAPPWLPEPAAVMKDARSPRDTCPRTWQR